VPIIRKFPLIPGVDLAGSVLHSNDSRFQAGDRVVVNGYGLGEIHHHRLSTDLDLVKLDKMTSRARLDDVPSIANEILPGKITGRMAIDL